MKKEGWIVIGILMFITMFAQYGIRNAWNARLNKAYNNGATALYQQMNSDLNTQLGLHYNIQKRRFEKSVKK